MDHDKFRLSHTAYVVGMPQVGGCWLPSGEAYKEYDDALEALMKIKAKNPHAPDLIFNIEVYERKEN